ncbi:vWFA domain containing protein [uncultured Caudovirales phage]|uniref:VWFA domain containing protein n=1 Tax=uncultured Caudovirales phage TaxID=2100421 RepID=A0A6J5LHI5_9CAUD|nr:vWFA domain containing protein [uncultured Caudovirales phage]
MTAATAERKKTGTITDPKIDAAAREKLTTARIGLLLKAPFFGTLATRMTLTNADEWCGTAATDGRKFYYNSEFVNNMPLKQLEFLVGHEVLHAVYDHMGRRGDRMPKMSNIAADYVVNGDLIDQRIGEKISVVPILYDQKYRGWSYEEVYDDLYKNADKINMQQLEQMLLDDHLEEDGEGDGEDGNGKPKLSKEEAQAIRDEIKGAVISAAQAAGAGNVPAGVKRLLKDLTEPAIDWRELINQQIQSVIKNDFTWARPSRRGWDMDAVMPGLKPGEMIDVCISLDQSGSISEEDSRIFLSEVKGIMEQFQEYKVTIWCFDTEIYNVQTYTSDNIDNIMDYEPMGGGGTDFMANWEFMKENGIEPKKFIMFTDGMPFGEWGEEQYCETCWIIKGNPDCEPPWGIWAHYEEAAKG